ncbi:amino acid permease [Laceyella putida]|uniref:Amino acid permease n=1 Tax=Laceyella putida TaxID=110101 RepID=A0ABW2RKY1_9BACL
MVELSLSRVQAGQNEDILKRELTDRQLVMIGLGSAIGTGLFMGSSLSIHYAGPAVILSYLGTAVIVVMMVYCLAKMSMVYPTAGSFGIHAEKVLGPWFGYLVRYTYWAANAITVGGEATAVGLYMKMWFPAVPTWIWVVLFAFIIFIVNAMSVKSFGLFEYWFSSIKVLAIVGFIVLGGILIFGDPSRSMSNLQAQGGFIPHGWSGIWMGIVMATFSFMGTEIVAVTAGEAKQPKKVLMRSMKWLVLRLILFYVLAMTVMLAVVPWDQVGGETVEQSPFVKVLEHLDIPFAAGVMNVIILTAAMSTMNANLYACTRMMFSLAQSGFAPRAWGKVNDKGVPLHALTASSFGLGVAVLLNLLTPKAYNTMFGISIFGGIFTWIIIFVTYFCYRRQTAHKLSWAALTGAGVLAAILLTMLLDAAWMYAIVTGLVWIGSLSAVYWIMNGKKAKQAKASS